MNIGIKLLLNIKAVLLSLIIAFNVNSCNEDKRDFENYSKGRIVYYSSLADIHSIYKEERNTVFASGLLMGASLSCVLFSMLFSWDIIEFKHSIW